MVSSWSLPLWPALFLDTFSTGCDALLPWSASSTARPLTASFALAPLSGRLSNSSAYRPRGDVPCRLEVAFPVLIFKPR